MGDDDDGCSAVLVGVTATDKTSVSFTDGDVKVRTFDVAPDTRPVFHNIRPGRYSCAASHWSHVT